MADPVGIKYKHLKQTHPRVNLMRLRILKALYRGGTHLLNDDAVMKIVFPKYTYENDAVYAERRSRAFYENLFALVINQMAAGLAQDPARAVPKVNEPGASIEDYWSDFMECATAPDEDGSEQRTFDQMMRDFCVEGLVCGWAWTQIELPKPTEEIKKNRAEQEEAGDLDAYLCQWPTDQIMDWEEKDGKLLWLKTYECKQIAETPGDSRDTKRHTWTIWDREKWSTYVVIETKSTTDPVRYPPGDDEVILVDDTDKHSFKRVPWIKIDFCTQGTYLHIGDFIESSCRSYFNRTNGEAFQWTQYNFQQLYEFLAPETPGIDTMISEAQTNPDRARGVRAPGKVHVRGHEDKAMFIGPDMGGASSGRQAIQDQRDAILRMATQMALSQDTSGAMLRRSGESKAQDAVAQEILLGSIGKRLLTSARQTIALIASCIGLNPEDEDVPDIEGYARFSITDADTLINQAVLLEKVQIPSATYQIERKYRMAITDLGDAASDEMKDAIHDELGQAITQENLNWTMQPPEEPTEGPEPEDDGSGEVMQ